MVCGKLGWVVQLQKGYRGRLSPPPRSLHSPPHPRALPSPGVRCRVRGGWARWGPRRTLGLPAARPRKDDDGRRARGRHAHDAAPGPVSGGRCRHELRRRRGGGALGLLHTRQNRPRACSGCSCGRGACSFLTPPRFCAQDASWDARQLELEHARACDLSGREGPGGVDDAEGAGACAGFRAPEYSPSDASELEALSCEVCLGAGVGHEKLCCAGVAAPAGIARARGCVMIQRNVRLVFEEFARLCVHRC